MLSNPGKHITINSVAGIIRKSFSKSFSKHNVEKGFHLTRIYPLKANIFGEDEFLSSYVTDRTYNQVIELTSAPSRSMDNNEERMLAGILKMSSEIVRVFPKDGSK
jgi:hypothetical protein